MFKQTQCFCLSSSLVLCRYRRMWRKALWTDLCQLTRELHLSLWRQRGSETFPGHEYMWGMSAFIAVTAEQTFTLQHSLVLFLLCEENKYEIRFDYRTSYHVCLLLLEGVLNPYTWGGCSAALLLSGCASKGNNWRGEDNLEWQSNALSGFDACKGVVTIIIDPTFTINCLDYEVL